MENMECRWYCKHSRWVESQLPENIPASAPDVRSPLCSPLSPIVFTWELPTTPFHPSTERFHLPSFVDLFPLALLLLHPPPVIKQRVISSAALRWHPGHFGAASWE